MTKEEKKADRAKQKKFRNYILRCVEIGARKYSEKDSIVRVRSIERRKP